MRFLKSTRSRGRTGTTLLSLVFETNASTDSAIRADFRVQTPILPVSWPLKAFPPLQNLSASKSLRIKVSPLQNSPLQNLFHGPQSTPTGSYPRPSRRIGWTKIEKIPRLQAFFPNYFQNRTPGLHRNSGGITSPPRNSPAPCAPSPGRSAPTAPPSSQHAPSPPSGNDATASRSSSHQSLQSLPAHCG